MTIKECIDAVDNLKPNQYTLRDKVQWLSFVDETIINDVLKTHEGYDGRYDTFTGYTEEDLDVSLIVQSPYDRLYTAFLVMKIDHENGEIARYNNSASLYNAHLMEFKKYYNKTHMPLSLDARVNIKPCKPIEHITEAQVEAITRDLYYSLSDDLKKATSYDVMYSIVTTFVNNNVQMLKGKDGTVSFNDLTDEQKESLKGKDGKDGKDGVDGTVSFDELSEEQRESLKGDPFTYEDFTAEQLAALKGEPGKDGETPDLTNYVQKTDYATLGGEYGLVKLKDATLGLYLKDGEYLSVVGAGEKSILGMSSQNAPIVPKFLPFATKVGLLGNTDFFSDKTTTNAKELTEDEKTAVANWLGTNKIMTGSYVGTGTAPKVLEFDRKPLIVFIGANNVNSSGFMLNGQGKAGVYFANGEYYTADLSWSEDGKTLTISLAIGTDQPVRCFNHSGTTYNWVAILE